VRIFNFIFVPFAEQCSNCRADHGALKGLGDPSVGPPALTANIRVR
jgi:hypothetical protein